MRELLEEAGFPWARSHTVRKTVATKLDKAGLTAREIANHLGHSDIGSTMIYMDRRQGSPRAATALWAHAKKPPKGRLGFEPKLSPSPLRGLRTTQWRGMDTHTQGCENLLPQRAIPRAGGEWSSHYITSRLPAFWRSTSGLAVLLSAIGWSSHGRCRACPSRNRAHRTRCTHAVESPCQSSGCIFPITEAHGCVRVS